MNQFARYITLIFLPPLMLLWAIWVLPLLLDPLNDSNLHKLHPTDYEGLILGTSRAAQGIDPLELAHGCELLSGGFNFAFNISDSPWSAQYATICVAQIEKAPEASLNYLLLSIDPWSLMPSTKSPSPWIDINDANLCIRAHRYALASEILPRVLGSSESNLATALVGRIKSSHHNPYRTRVTEQGWLPNKRYRNPEWAAEETQRHIANYRKTYPRNENWPSAQSLSGIKSIVSSFKERNPTGHIIFLRPPVTQEMLNLEDEVFPEFESMCEELAEQQDVAFVDANVLLLTLHFNDAHHLHFEDAQTFSFALGENLCPLFQPTK